MTEPRIYTPNVKKLIIRYMSVLAIPEGSGQQAIVHGARVFFDPGKLAQLWRESEQWVEKALAAVKAAPDNPYGDDDEAIATELFKRLETKEENSGPNEL